MRTNSSRQVSGSETVCTTAGKPLLSSPGSAFGMRDSSACPTGLIGIAAGLAPFLFGQFFAAAAPEHKSVKSPFRSASEGTFTAPVVCGFFSRRHSSEKKKKVFFLLEL